MSPLNVGNLDRALRILLGLGLIALSLTGTLGAWGWFGLVPLATGIAASCPLYRLLGVRSTAR